MAHFIRAKLLEQELWVTLNVENIEYYVDASGGSFCKTISTCLNLAASQEELDTFLSVGVSSKNVQSLPNVTPCIGSLLKGIDIAKERIKLREEQQATASEST